MKPLQTIDAAVSYLKDNKLAEEGTPLVVLSDTLRDSYPVDSILLIYA